MIILKNKIFIHIPKTSGSNFRNNIIKAYPRTDYSNYCLEDNQFGNLNFEKINNIKKILIENFNDIKIENMGKKIFISKFKFLNDHFLTFGSDIIKHSPVNLWEKYGIYKDQSIFTIVRNPYTRFVSHYENTIEHLKLFFNFNKPSLKEFINNKIINSIVGQIGLDYRLNQVDYLTNISGNIVCNKFYKIETDQENLSIDFNIPNLNKTKINQKNYNRDYSNLYNDELINWVQKKYKKDFEYFSYDITPFWK